MIISKDSLLLIFPKPKTILLLSYQAMCAAYGIYFFFGAAFFTFNFFLLSHHHIPFQRPALGDA
jgi:hypothetical protein